MVIKIGVAMGECMSRRERKKQETRQHLLEAAWQLFRKKGYDDTTVQEIAEAADVAKSTFFNYFETKEAIMNEIALWRIELLGNRVLGTEHIPENAVDRIKLLMEAMVEEFAPRQELTRHMFLARIGAPVRHQSAHRIGSLMQELVMQGQTGGEIRGDIESGFVARLLMTCWFYHFSRWWHEKGDFPQKGELARAVDVLMSGLQGEKRRLM
jgi:AcrR family transcriptional regulator